MLSVELGLLVAAASSATFAFITHRNAIKARQLQIVYDLLFEYGTFHMRTAMRSLREFHTEWTKKGNNLEARYEKIKEEEEEECEKRPVFEKTQCLEHTLHSQRCLVSNFYMIMKMTLDRNLVPKKYIFRYWNSVTLKEILDIIDPLGYDKDKRLRSLYDQAVEYAKRHPKKEAPIDR